MTNYVVTTLADENNAGASVGSPGGSGLSLREAINLANADSAADTITFLSGLSGTITLGSGELDITTSMTIDGGGAITVSGNSSGRIIEANDGIASGTISVTLNNLTLRDGSVTGGGAAGGGGAIYVGISDHLTLQNDTFANNTASTGGAIYADKISNVSITNSTFSGNSAGQGGAIYSGNSIANQTQANDGQVTVTGSTLSGNHATGNGGAIDLVNGNLTVSYSTVSGNSAANGGGVYLPNTTTSSNGITNYPTIHDTTFAGNTASSSGGGIYDATPANNFGLVAYSLTITGNTAQGGQGGGIYAPGITQLRSSIVAGNSAAGGGADVEGNLDSGGVNLFGTTSGATFTFLGTLNGQNVYSDYDDIVDGNLSDYFKTVQNGAAVLANNGGQVQTVALKATGNAIDKGGTASGTDARGTGFARTVDGPDSDSTATSDLGAYEVQRSVANAQTVGTNEDNAVSGTVTGSDPDGAVTYAVSGTPSHGTVTAFNPTTGAFTFLPAQDYNGAASFQFTASRDGFDGNAATVTVNVAAVNDAPVANGDSYTTQASTPLTVAAPGVLANDTDVDSTGLTAGLVSGPSHGGLTFSSDGSFKYTPAIGYYGADSFTYQASDGSALSSPATVTLTVNAAPTITLQGKLDVVTANTANVSVLLGDGSGNFAATTAGLGGGSLAFAAALGDVNGDGKPDIVTANSTSSNVSVLLGDGTGGFTVSTKGIGGGTAPRSVALGDVNGDGKLDIVTANSTSDTVSVLLGDGAGGFTATTTGIGGGSGPSGVAVGDLNGDGKLDIVTANANTSNLSVLLGDGTGGFTASTTSSGRAPSSVALGDVNGDGKLDIVTANYSSNNVSVLLGNGLGGFTASTIGVGGGGNPNVAALGDVNGDGKLDIVTANYGSSNVSVLIGDGLGGFSASTTSIAGGSHPYDVTLGDVNGDGKLDIITANRLSSNVSVLLGDGTGGFTPSLKDIGGGSNPSAVALGDLNNLQVTAEDTNLVFSSANGNALAVGDPDAGSASETVSLAVAHGALTLSGTTGLGFTGGDGTADAAITFSGTLANINAALNGLIYRGAQDYNGSDAVTVTINDGQATAAKLVPIGVTAVNDAPSFTLLNTTTSSNEDAGPQTIAGFATGISSGPSDESGQSVSFVVIGDTNAALFSSGPAIAANGTLTYTAAPNANGAATITVHAHDTGGTANNGVDNSGDQTFTITVNPVADTPSVTSASTNEDTQSTTGLVVSRNAVDGSEVGYVKVTGITNGALFQHDGTTAIATGSFITYAQANAGLKFTPSANYFGTGSFGVQASTSASDAGLGGGIVTANVTVNAVADTPSVSDATTIEDTQTSTGLVVSRNAADGSEVGYVKVAGITNGALFQHDGTTAIANGSFITYAQANAGLKFTPFADFFGNGSFQVQASTSASDAGLGGSVATATVTVNSVNDAPSFTLASPATNSSEDAGPQTVTGFATGISPGPSNEGGQTVSFFVTADTNAALFSSGPAIASDGTLTYTAAPNANGAATITVHAQDNGGNANGGVDSSGDQTFSVTVGAVNDAPSFTVGADQTVLEDAGPQTVAAFATALSPGPSNESSQTVALIVTADSNAALFSAGPTIAPNGTLTYTTAPNANGTATITVHAHDNGGTANGGTDSSTDQSFTITVGAVNDAPSFTISADQMVMEDGGARTVAGFATGVSAGPSDENAQAVSFVVTGNTNEGLFSSGPMIAPDGTLTYTAAPNANGAATITVHAHDNGGIANGGTDSSTDQSFTITVSAVNDAPSFTIGADQMVLEDAGAQTVASFVTDVSAGPSDENAQAVSFVVTGDTNADLFSSGPMIASDGTLTYTAAPNANGAATITVHAHDNGGTANGGTDSSTDQSFTITVGAVNDAPTVSGPGTTQAAPEDTGLVFSSGNGNAITVSDVDVGSGDGTVTVSVQHGTLTLGSGAATVTGGQDGSASVIVTGTLTELNQTLAGLTFRGDQDYNGPDTLTITIDDGGNTGSGGALSASQPIAIDVTAVNDAPVTMDDALAPFVEGTGTRVIQFAELLGNDSPGPADEAGQSLTVSSVGNAIGGTVSIQGGHVQFTPAAGFAGTASFDYLAQDDGSTNGAPDPKSALGHVTFQVQSGLVMTGIGGPGNVVDHVVSGNAGGSLAGTNVTVFEGAMALGSGPVWADGTWSAGIVFAQDGVHDLIARDGPVSSNQVSFTLDSSPNKPLFGTITNDPHSNGGEIYALYDAILDRQPDGPGFEDFVRALNSGAPLRDIAQGFLNSPEGRQHVNAASNADFVEQLYETALHRHGDDGGASFIVNALNGGASRADVAIGFALSAENIGQMKPAFDAGVFVPDADASNVARFYYGLLDRAPDPTGLQAFTNAAHAGTSLHDLAEGFLNSQEFTSKGPMSDGDYVEGLYQHALGRHSEPDGYSTYVTALQNGVSRADVAVAIADSPEAHGHLNPLIESGWHLS